MTQQSLELILDLYKDGKIEKENAVSLIEDLSTRYTHLWTYPSYQPSYPITYEPYCGDKNFPFTTTTCELKTSK